MKYNLLKSLIFIHLIFTVLTFSQTSKPTPPIETDSDVVKVSTSLVQVDAVVTDKNGNPVTNLTAADFEILQDGKLQTITNVYYVNRTVKSETSTPIQTIVTKKTDKNIPIPPASRRSTEFGRVLTFVVDDGNCDATQSGMIAVQEGLEKFVKEQMQPNDSVAIYQTRAGSLLLQQYTTDKSALLKIIKKIRWYPPNGICNTITGSDYEPVRDQSTLKDGGTFESETDAAIRKSGEDSIRDRQITGVVGVAKYAISGLQQVGGRKILFLMSDSLAISNGRKMYPQANSAVRDLATLANRASVVINPIDVRGLNVTMIQAVDDLGGIKNDAMAADKVVTDRMTFDDSRQSGLAYIANETGGKFYRNMNNLDVPIEKALKPEQGYYLIGYQPEDETFKGKDFHKIEIKLKRPDLTSSSRSGFYGITDEAMRPKPRSGDSELYDVLTAPLPNADMNIQLSAYFANSAAKGNFIHALLYIDGKDISFVDGSNGNKKAVFDIVAVTLDEKNKVIDDSNSTRTIQIPSDKVEEIQRNGLIYTVDVPVKKEGTYTFRTALREVTAKRLGSSSQVIEVPNLKKDKVYLSGLTISGVDANGKMSAEGTENGFSTVVSKAVPAIRQFQRNTIVGYSYTIYNARIDAATNQPKVTIQMNLYQDGKLVSEGKAQAAQISSQTDMTRIRNVDYIRLSPQVILGDYAVQIIIKDLVTNQTTSQWIDFQVVE